MFWVEHRKTLQRRNLAEDLVGGDGIISQSRALQPERDRELYRIECAKPPVERMLLDQTLCLRERQLLNRDDFELSCEDIVAKLA